MLDGVITRDGLFEVQRRALEEAGDKSGFAYFLEQGLGKTRLTWHEFHEKVTRDLADVLVVTCPMSLRGAWVDEKNECGYPYPSIIAKTVKKTLKIIDEEFALQRRRPGGKVSYRPFALIFHYELSMYQADELVNALIERGLRIFWALDESVRIKSHSSSVGEKLYFLGEGKHRVHKGIIQRGPNKGKPKYVVEPIPGREPVAFRRILSGTPAPQGAHDLWAQFRFIGTMETTPFFQWRHLFCKMGGFMGKKVVGIKNLDVLKFKTGPFAFRAKKKDWTDLPEKLWAHPREVDLTAKQRQAYLEIMHEMVLELGEDEYITVEMAISVKNKLQQICSGWIYDNEHTVHEIVPLADNPKLQDLREFIENIQTKVLVFYFFRPTRDYLEQLAQEMGIGYTFLESGLKMAEFEARKKEFNTNDDIQIAFCQTDAVKEGHTLLGTADRPCYTTYFLENTYSLYARAQAEDRNHRHGQYNPVTYHDVVTSREDKAIIKALQKKGELQEALLSEFTAYREKKGTLDG